MRLISCDIENFGKLSGVHMDFSEGINYIYGENGWGKSTLAAFVRVMLYGLERDGKRDKLDRDRSRYQPWQGGAYGGRLAVSLDDKEYEIERSFGSKAADDRLVVRDMATNLETDELGLVPGETLFGLDSVSFANSVFIGAGSCQGEITGGIKNRIGHEGMEYQDLGLYDNASASLHVYLNKMSPSRATGLLNKEKKELADMEYRMSFKERYENISQEKTRYIEDSQAKLEDMKAARKQLGDENRKRIREDKAQDKTEYDNRSNQPNEGVRLILGVLCLGLWLAAGSVYYLRRNLILAAILAGLGLLCLIIRIVYSGRAGKLPDRKEDYYEPEDDELTDRIEVLNDTIERLMEDISRAKSDLKDAIRVLDELEELSVKYAKLKEEYKNNSQSYQDAKLCQELLEEANNNLMQRYTKPLKESFARNYNIMTGSGGDKLTLDVKGNIGWIEAGSQRDIRSLSTGYQDIIGLCSRMAYIETMYAQEKPVVIMDDPFLHLDENNKEGAERLLLELGKRYQVIYLSCNRGL